MDALKSYNAISSQVDHSKPWDGRVQSTMVSLQQESRKNGQSSDLQYTGEATRTEGDYRGQGVHEVTQGFSEELSKGGVHIAHNKFQSTLQKGGATGQAAEESYRMFDAGTGQAKDIDRDTYNRLFSQLTAGKEQWFAQNRVQEQQ
ncbi:MAG: hypothetical protein FJX76_23485 [Armatimonadetes bacterium]|nr:hypothetical protein [Armatimonadota bacterium]